MENLFRRVPLHNVKILSLQPPFFSIITFSPLLGTLFAYPHSPTSNNNAWGTTSPDVVIPTFPIIYSASPIPSTSNQSCLGDDVADVVLPTSNPQYPPSIPFALPTLQNLPKFFTLSNTLIINPNRPSFKNFSKNSFKNIWWFAKNPVLLHSQFSDKAHRQTSETQRM